MVIIEAPILVLMGLLGHSEPHFAHKGTDWQCWLDNLRSSKLQGCDKVFLYRYVQGKRYCKLKWLQSSIVIQTGSIIPEYLIS